MSNYRNNNGRSQPRRAPSPTGQSTRFTPISNRRTGSAPSTARRRRSRYRLKYPGRLIVAVLLVVILIVISVSCGLKNRSAEEESSSPIETVTAHKQVETGTIKPVSAVTLQGMGPQLTTYMASMIYSNLTNYKRTSQNPNEETPNTDTVDLTPYRYVVAINPRAGGANNGWTADDVTEKNITLAIARQLVDWLNNNSTGYYFLLVRDADVTMTDSARLSRINNYEADLIVTLACNGSDMELGGVIASYNAAPVEYDDDGDPKNQSDRDRWTSELAEKIMEECADGLTMWYRETHVEDDDPLLNTEVPSVKVYMGFLTYGPDVYKVSDEANQAAAAAKMGQVILNFCNAHAPEKTRGQIAGEALANSTKGDSEASESSAPSYDSTIIPISQDMADDEDTDEGEDADWDDWDEDDWEE